jgi:hypothetical protein
MALTYITFGLFLTALAMLWWQPTTTVGRLCLVALWLVVFGFALVSIPFSWFAGFWDKSVPWGAGWASATLVVLLVVAARNPWPSSSE